MRIVWRCVRRVIENQKISYFLAWIDCIFGHVDLAFAWVNSDITYTRYLLWPRFEVVFGNIQFWLLQVINVFGLHRFCPWPIFVQNFCWAVLNMLFQYVSWLWCVNAILNKDIHDKKKYYIYFLNKSLCKLTGKIYLTPPSPCGLNSCEN